MAPQIAQLFEDDLALIRCLPHLNNLRIAGDLTDLAIELLNSAQLRNACLQYMKTTFEAVIASDFFLQLPSDAVLFLLRANDLEVDKEESVFKAIRLWYALPQMKEVRSHAAAVALPDGRVFLIGGECSSFCPLSSVEACHLRTSSDWKRQPYTSGNFWRTVASMNRPRTSHAAVAFKGSIFVAGGSTTNHQPVNTVEVFTPPSNPQQMGQWTMLWNSFRHQVNLRDQASYLRSVGTRIPIYIRPAQPWKSPSRQARRLVRGNGPVKGT
ncbi:unnamed protein product [Dibothriocephalus latus]|uniref:BACK domain-containing protein n=1 Tax=Dibothriocephalus latus TaxID=60516 RepID=A0A3P7LJV3_DIBLA|nr:unnamed protein product [Dibothriocephalus latus]